MRHFIKETVRDRSHRFKFDSSQEDNLLHLLNEEETIFEACYESCTACPPVGQSFSKDYFQFNHDRA